jgi:hypothetical protein
VASLRHQRRRSCEGKVRYETQAEAVAALIGVQRAGARGVHTYACKRCGGWHVGHTPYRILQSRAAQAREAVYA